MNNPKIYAAILIIVILVLPVNGGWAKHDSGTFAWLYSVFFLDENQGWISGSQGTFLTTVDGGRTWKPEKKFTSDSIRDIYFKDQQTGWLLCERSVYERGSKPPSYLLQTVDGGRNWQRIDPFHGPGRITRIIFSKSGASYAVGEAGTLWRADENESSWKLLPPPVRFLILDGTFAAPLRTVLVGAGSTVIFSDDGGLNWIPSVLPAGPKAKINSVFFAASDVGWLAGAGGKIYVTNNGGSIWTGQATPVTVDLTDIAFAGLRRGFAVGENGIILRTTNGGTVWEVEPTETKHRLESIFLTGAKGFAVGFGGTILVNDLADASSGE